MATNAASRNTPNASNSCLILFRDFDRLWYRVDETGFNKIGYITQRGTVVHPILNRGLTESSLDTILTRPHSIVRLRIDRPSRYSDIEKYFTGNARSIELFESGILAINGGHLCYFDNPIRIPELDDISGQVFEERWKTFCSVLQLGDVIFVFDTKSLISRLIARFDHGIWSHVGLYCGTGKITEAIAAGVVERSVEAYHNSRYRLGVYRSTGLSKSQAEEVVANVRSKIGNGYDFRGFIRLAVSKILGIRPRGAGSHGPNGLARSDRLMLIQIV